MPLEVKAFFNLIIIKMPITAYSMEPEVFFGSCNIKFVYFVIFVQFCSHFYFKHHSVEQ